MSLYQHECYLPVTPNHALQRFVQSYISLLLH